MLELLFGSFITNLPCHVVTLKSFIHVILCHSNKKLMLMLKNQIDNLLLLRYFLLFTITLKLHRRRYIITSSGQLINRKEVFNCIEDFYLLTAKPILTCTQGLP